MKTPRLLESGRPKASPQRLSEHRRYGSASPIGSKSGRPGGQSHAVKPNPTAELNQAVILRFLPFLVASLIVFFSLAAGWIEQLVPTVQANHNLEFPGTLSPEIPVLKASVETQAHKRLDSDLVYTSHTVKKGDTLSRLAYKYGLMPSTLTSANRLSGSIPLKPGEILIVPYADGTRVTPKGDESAVQTATRYGVSSDAIHRFPDSLDFFIPGYVNDRVELRSVGDNHFRYPVQGRVLTAYGESVDSLTEIPFESDGIDLSASAGSPVNAARPGTVILTGNHSSYGLYVMISHTGGWKSFYGYLSRIVVAPGDVVSNETVIGRVGDSGVARSPRLHFVLFQGKDTVDPLDYLY